MPQQVSVEATKLGGVGASLWDPTSVVWGEPLKASVPAVLLGQRQNGLRGFILTV